MTNFFKNIINFFSPYTNPFEKKVDQFLEKLRPNSDKSIIQKKVLELMQEDVVIFHLWCERRYKGYRYLNKKKRRELYENVKKIQESFNNFCETRKINVDDVLQDIKDKNINTASLAGKEKELQYLAYIMTYFSGPEGKFLYQESSNFGELLKDPNHEKLIGDCNQIVTLYAYLFSLRYDVSKIQIKIYPGHVCLHFNGVDIEATSGAFKKYDEKDQKVLPITELIAVNLLDISDFRRKKFNMSPKSFLECSKITFLLSGDRKIAEHNLKAAYQNIVIKAVKDKKYDIAMTYANQSGEEALAKNTSHNAAVYFLKQNQFEKAKKYSKFTGDPKLNVAILKSEGIYYYKNENYQKALPVFQKINNTELIKHCYTAMFMELQKEIKSIKTIDQLKQKKFTIQKMHEYAKKSQNQKLIKYIEGLLKQIG